MPSVEMNVAVTHPPKLPPHAERRRVFAWVWLVGLAVLGGLWLIKTIPPAGQLFFPRCWLYQTTGLQCPGCGATRAVHALLNGEFLQAFRYNALITLGLPIGAWVALRGMYGWRTGRWWPDPVRHPASLAILGGLVVGYAVARNFLP